MSEILGMDPIVVTILIVIIGVGINNTIGWLKSTEKVQPKKIAASVLIGGITAFGVVMPAVQKILSESTADEYTQFIAVIIAITSVAGVDTLVKNATKAIKKS